MKTSKYNFFIKNDDDTYLAYNSRSNALAVIENDNYKKYVDFETNGKEIEDLELVNKLKEGYFLIDDDIDELKILRFKMYKDRMSERFLGLTIAPTSDCNFRCVYCYEKGAIKSKSMSMETENAIFRFVESLKSKISSLSISWYGGEPLMRFDVIERLSEKFIRLCYENNISYQASMVTNGYLLTEEISKKLKDYKINYLQITVDGPKEIHDRRRMLANGEGTFDKIMDNLVSYKEFLPNISLRINIDKSNFNTVTKLYDLLNEKQLLDFVSPYLGHVRAENGCYNNNKCISLKDYSELTFNFQTLIKRELRAFYPISRSKLCGADSLYSFVIDSDGTLYKCWNDIGIKSKEVGNILNSVSINMVNVEYLTLDATLDKKCSRCKYLPICMGGCPVSFAKEENCTYFKYNIDKYLKYVAENI